MDDINATVTVSASAVSDASAALLGGSFKSVALNLPNVGTIYIVYPGGSTGTNPTPAAAASPPGGLFDAAAISNPVPQEDTLVAAGNIFAGHVSASQLLQPFGGGGSIFGGPAKTCLSSSSGFGSLSQTVPAPGGFAQGAGSSVAKSGFGSLETQQQAAPGGFGAKPVFGGSLAFGASPTFGKGATFGSFKEIGSLGANPNEAAPPALGAPEKLTGGNNFDASGGQESGISFGNLAQTGNLNAQKSGSSFMNYR